MLPREPGRRRVEHATPFRLPIFPTVFLLLAPFLLRDGEFTLLNAQLRPLSDGERSGADDGA